jgi:hypothetical protein
MIFLSHEPADIALAQTVASVCEARGLRVWRGDTAGAVSDVLTDRNQAITTALAVIVVLSPASTGSLLCRNELKRAKAAGVRCIAISAGAPAEAELAYWRASGGIEAPLEADAPDFRVRLATLLMSLDPGAVQPSALAPQTLVPQGLASPLRGGLTSASSGRFFINFSSLDRVHVDYLRTALDRIGAPHWDFLRGDRNLERALAHEIEEAINKSVGVLSVVTNNWRDSQWVLREYLFAREILKPTWLLLFEPTRPTLVIAERTFIDFTGKREEALQQLQAEIAGIAQLA